MKYKILLALGVLTAYCVTATPVSKEYVDAATNSIKLCQGEAKMLPPYLHVLDFYDSYEDDAKWYCDKIDRIGYCSSVRQGNTYARNFDWYYDYASSFVVIMFPGPSRFASVGISAVGTNLTEEIVTSGKHSRFYKCLPGMTLDGINENGVVCNINVVSTNLLEDTQWTGTNLNILCAVRYVLDHATNAADAATYVAANAYIPDSMKRHGYSIHMMIADEGQTWIVEDGIASNVTHEAITAMTNFRRFDPTEPFGTGHARYSILTNAGPSAITSAWFKAAYEYPFTRLDELAGSEDENGRIPYTDIARLNAWAEKNVAPNLPAKRKNGGGFWQTVHTSVYDITSRTVRVAVQETDDWYAFSVPMSVKKTQALPTKAQIEDILGYRAVIQPDGSVTLEFKQ